jgi:hypothetical protein
VEEVVRGDEALNVSYRAFRSGKSELKQSEMYQIGFRLASELCHERIYAIDWMEQGEGKKRAWRSI